ncbi:MAG: hypothetical protein JNL82_14340 [Myxococcales bacterium]|nr:hypothetical protein [Myxococcales bacterium]
MAGKKRKGVNLGADDDSKQGTSRTAHHHDITTSYDGEGSWSVKVFFGDQLRQTIKGFRFEGDAYWAGDDWAHLNRILVPDTKVAGKDQFAPVVFENGVELVRLAPRSTATEALDYAEQYVDQMRLADRERVEKKQAKRAEYILKMREFDLVEAGLEKKVEDAKEALKLLQERREEYIESVRNPQVSFNFVFDRKKAKQTDIEDATNMLAGLGAKPPKPGTEPKTTPPTAKPGEPRLPPKKDKGDDATGGEAHP